MKNIIAIFLTYTFFVFSQRTESPSTPPHKAMNTEEMQNIYDSLEKLPQDNKCEIDKEVNSATVAFHRVFRACILDQRNYTERGRFTVRDADSEYVLENANMICDSANLNYMIAGDIDFDWIHDYDDAVRMASDVSPERRTALNLQAEQLTKNALKKTLKQHIVNNMMFDSLLTHEDYDLLDSSGRLSKRKIMKMACDKHKEPWFKRRYAGEVSRADKRTYDRYKGNTSSLTPEEKAHYYDLKMAMESNNGRYVRYSKQNTDKLEKEYFELMAEYEANGGFFESDAKKSRLDYLEYGYKRGWRNPRTKKYKGGLGLDCSKEKRKKQFEAVVDELISELDKDPNNPFSAAYTGEKHFGDPTRLSGKKDRGSAWMQEVDDLITNYNELCTDYRNQLESFNENRQYNQLINLYNSTQPSATFKIKPVTDYRKAEKIEANIEKLARNFVARVDSVDDLNTHPYLKYAKYKSKEECPPVTIRSTGIYTRNENGVYTLTDHSTETGRNKKCEFFFDNPEYFTIQITIPDKPEKQEARYQLFDDLYNPANGYDSYIMQWDNRVGNIQNSANFNIAEKFLLGVNSLNNNLTSADVSMNQTLDGMKTNQNVLLPYLMNDQVVKRSLNLSDSFKNNCLNQGLSKDLTINQTRQQEGDDNGVMGKFWNAVTHEFPNRIRKTFNKDGHEIPGLQVHSELFNAINEHWMNTKDELMGTLDDFVRVRKVDTNEYTSRNKIREYANRKTRTSSEAVMDGDELEKIENQYRDQGLTGANLEKAMMDHYKVIAYEMCQGLFKEGYTQQKYNDLYDATMGVSMALMPASFVNPYAAGVSAAAGIAGIAVNYFKAKRDFLLTRGNYLEAHQELLDFITEQESQTNDETQRAKFAELRAQVHKVSQKFEATEFNNTVFDGAIGYGIEIALEAPDILACIPAGNLVRYIGKGAGILIDSTKLADVKKTAQTYDNIQNATEELNQLKKQAEEILPETEDLRQIAGELEEFDDLANTGDGASRTIQEQIKVQNTSNDLIVGEEGGINMGNSFTSPLSRVVRDRVPQYTDNLLLKTDDSIRKQVILDYIDELPASTDPIWRNVDENSFLGQIRELKELSGPNYRDRALLIASAMDDYMKRTGSNMNDFISDMMNNNITWGRSSLGNKPSFYFEFAGIRNNNTLTYQFRNGDQVVRETVRPTDVDPILNALRVTRESGELVEDLDKVIDLKKLTDEQAADLVSRLGNHPDEIALLNRILDEHVWDITGDILDNLKKNLVDTINKTELGPGVKFGDTVPGKKLLECIEKGKLDNMGDALKDIEMYVKNQSKGCPLALNIISNACF